ncbi:Protein suppressor of forked [Gryllus bimaculatus]|nr:Protein suppressor of forked [Gryllus bimaculatus]
MGPSLLQATLTLNERRDLGVSSSGMKGREAERQKGEPTVLSQDWGNEKLQKAQRQIDDNAYDLEAWSLLIREAQTKWIGEMRPLFEKLVGTFPSAGRYWKIYIEQEK